MRLVTVQTASLEGEALNWAVGKADGRWLQVMPAQYGVPCRVFIETPSGLTRYRPVVEWAQAGELLEKHRVDVSHDDGTVYADVASGSRPEFGTSDRANEYSRAPRTAICRAVVAAVSGSAVDVPEELL